MTRVNVRYAVTGTQLTARLKSATATRTVLMERTTSNVRTKKELETFIVQMATASRKDDATERLNVQMVKMRRTVEVRLFRPYTAVTFTIHLQLKMS